MNILFYSEVPPIKAGAENALYYVTSNLSQRNKVILQFNYSRKKQIPRIPFGNTVLKPVYFPDIPKFRIFYRNYSTEKNLEKNVKNNNIDILHTQFLVAGILTSNVSRKMKIPQVITEHGMVYFQKDQPKEVKKIRLAYKRSDRIICIDHNIFRIIKELCNDDSKLKLITNGVDEKEFFPNYEQRNPKRLLFNGRLIDIKGIDFLIDSLPDVIKEMPDAEIWILGDGPLREKIKSKAKKLGVEKNTKFLGWMSREKISEITNSCSVSVSLQSLENFPSLSLLESMSCANSIIATDIGLTKKHVGNGGVYVKYGDNKDLSEKIIDLLSDYKKSKKIGQNARKIIEKNHTWDMVVNKYEKIYQDLVSK